MTIWTSRGSKETRLPSFTKRRGKGSVFGSPTSKQLSPTTVLSPESSHSEFSSRVAPNIATPNSNTNSNSNSNSISNSISNSKGREEEMVLHREIFSTLCDTRTMEASFEQVDNQTWFVSTERPSDLLVEVDNACFHLHKLPILSRSALLNRLASQFSDNEKMYISLGGHVPGGSETFALVAKFCYGIALDLKPTNVAALRCAAEYFEMTEELEENNLITKAEAYLNTVVLNSWQESIIVLQSCELLLPWAEKLQILQITTESVAMKACSDPRGVRWVYSGSDYNAALKKPVKGVNLKNVPANWWYDDLSHLTFFCFSRVVAVIKQRGNMKSELLGGALEYYSQQWLAGVLRSPASDTTSSFSPRRSTSNVGSPPRFSKSSPDHLEAPSSPNMGTFCLPATPPVSEETAKSCPSRLHDLIADQNKNRNTIEEFTCLLPQQIESVSCSFLLRMLRAANMLDCSSDCKWVLERKAGLQLDSAILCDLLIPSFSHTSEYLFDVDLVRRLLEHFLALDRGMTGSPGRQSFEKKFTGIYELSPAQKTYPASPARTRVAKLLDAYLAEVARDSKLPLAKFQSLAEALPESSRASDDGLYKAIDTYLKIHPGLAEHEKKKLCRVLDCQRLSLDACLHAAQNERLPLRVVVQVLFSEQLKLRTSISEVRSSISDHNPATNDPQLRELISAVAQSPRTSASRHNELHETSKDMEIKALQRELALLRVKCNEMEKDRTSMQEQVQKLTRLPRLQFSSWSAGWKKLTKRQTPNSKDDVASPPPLFDSPVMNRQRWSYMT